MSGGLSLVIDSREQKPYQFEGMPTKVRKLNVGDYTIDGFSDKFAVERKSIDDFATSLGTDRERFEREVIRAQNLDSFVVMIEEDKERIEEYGGTGSCPYYYSRLYPNTILGTVEKWPVKYEKLDFVWAGNRRKAKRKTLEKLAGWYANYE